MTAWLIVAALAITLGAVIYVSLKDRSSSAMEIRRITEELEGQKQINKELVQYTKEITKINGDKEEIAQQIEEAKNEEEVMAIIAGLVRTNNDSVHK